MKPVPYFAAVISFLVLPTFMSVHADMPIPAVLSAAIADPRRPVDQVKLDAARKPAQLILFAELKAGDRVADFMPGNGYFTRIISVPQSLDVIWTAQNYHDLHDSFMGPANVGAVNRAFFKALKPGGIYLVVDHVAESGSGLRDTESLHRIDPIRLQKEIEAAGFILDAQSDVLRNPQDDHKLPVFDGRVRGQTDQVVYRFRKP